jgi:hypothetical protein
MCALLISLNISAKEKLSLGLGLGASYSGVGLNLSQLSDTEMKYVSTGCVSYSSYSGSACGLGVGWIKTDLFNTDSNKHGFGAYIGVVGKDSNQSSFSRKNSAKYGIGLGYHYFLNGISESGSNFGITLVSDSALFFQWGYQF